MSGVWFGVVPRMDFQKTCVLKEIGLHAHNMIIILDLIVIIIWEGGGELYDRLINTRVFTLNKKFI